MNAIKEMESFLVELHNIIEVIKEDSLPNSEYERIYNKMLEMIEDSQNTHE